MAYKPSKAIQSLGGDFYDPVSPAEFPETKLRYKDEAAANSIGLTLTEHDWAAHFGRFEPLPDNLPEPLALRYHGHQFRHYNPDIGDGRGFLFAQVYDDHGRLLDLGTKGSGQTPYSRQGDGRLTLLGGVREVLATRYLKHLGVNTSRSFCLIETGEALQRHDEPSPTRSAVLTRLSHSHIRFGTFQRQAFFGKRDNLETLVDYCIRHFYPEADNAHELFDQVVTKSAEAVASWMAAGFVHGVMNTDNMNITGESFDYGPYRFLPVYHPGFTAAYFDHHGLYAFARQPEAMGWNLAQLAQSLSLICEDQPLIDALDSYAEKFQAAQIRGVFSKLGIEPKDPKTNTEFINATYTYLQASEVNWPNFWHDWQGGAGRHDGPQLESYEGPDFKTWYGQLKSFEVSGHPPKTDKPASLLYDEIGELWKPIDQVDDWSLFEAKLATFN